MTKVVETVVNPSAPAVQADADTTKPDESPLGDQAYEMLLPQYQAIPVERLSPIKVDVGAAVTLAMGLEPGLLSLADGIQKFNAAIDVAYIKKLRTAALGLSYAHARYKGAADRSPVERELIERGMAAHETLLRDVETLAHREFIDATRLKDLQGPVGFKNLALDLTILASVLRDHWDKIQGKCAVTKEEVDEALRIAQQIFTTVGEKERGIVTMELAADMRLRAFAFLDQYLDPIRQAVNSVRWKEKDWDKYAPSLYASRAKPKDNSEPVIPDPLAEDTPAAAPGAATAAPNSNAATPADGSAGNGSAPVGPKANPFGK